MIDHVMRSRDGIKIHIVELFDPLGIEYCTFWFYSVVEKARHLFITLLEVVWVHSFSYFCCSYQFLGLGLCPCERAASCVAIVWSIWVCLVGCT
jgi:hypothetical protein